MRVSTWKGFGRVGWSNSYSTARHGTRQGPGHVDTSSGYVTIRILLNPYTRTLMYWPACHSTRSSSGRKRMVPLQGQRAGQSKSTLSQQAPFIPIPWATGLSVSIRPKLLKAKPETSNPDMSGAFSVLVLAGGAHKPPSPRRYWAPRAANHHQCDRGCNDSQAAHKPEPRHCILQHKSARECLLLATSYTHMLCWWPRSGPQRQRAPKHQEPHKRARPQCNDAPAALNRPMHPRACTYTLLANLLPSHISHHMLHNVAYAWACTAFGARQFRGFSHLAAGARSHPFALCSRFCLKSYFVVGCRFN